MATHRDIDDAVEGGRIYCVYERSRGPRRVGTRGRHNAQSLLIEGHPARAVVVRTIRGLSVAS